MADCGVSQTLPALGTFSYNGVGFGARCDSEVSIKPVYDASGRTVKFNQYGISVKTDLYNPIGSTDADMAQLRKLLTHPAGELHFEQKGLGDVVVNLQTGGGLRDCVWGPRPQVVKWQPHGNRHVSLEWVVEFAIPDCDAARYEFAVMEFVYTVGWSLDSGYSTRTIKGSLSIPQTRATVNSRALRDNADRYRERITPQIPTGFRRTRHDFELSLDKCTLTFNFTDEELPSNTPPPGCLECQMDHSVETDRALGNQWTGTLNGTYEMAKGADRSIPFRHFFDTLLDRMAQAKRFEDGGAMLTRFVVREPEIFGRKTAGFSASYRLLSTLGNIPISSGLWRPIPGSDWNRWAQSLANTAFHPRGNAKLAFQNSDDAIIDLCLPGTATLHTGGGGSTLRSFVPTSPSTLKAFKNPIPSSAASWLIYNCSLLVGSIDDVVELKTLPLSGISTLNTAPTGDPQGGGVNNVLKAGGGGGDANGGPQFQKGNGIPVGWLLPGQVGGPPPGGKLNNTQSDVQWRASPRYYAILEGYAVRAGYTCGAPVLLSVGGVPAIPNNREGFGVRPWNVANLWGLPMFGAMWRLFYILPDIPSGNIPIMDNPYLGT